MRFDYHLLVYWLLLMICGVVFIYSASSGYIGSEFATKNFYIKQAIWMLISIGMVYLLLKFPGHIIEALIPTLWGLSVLLLVAVLFTPAIKGSHRWIPLGIMNLQPSELAKTVTILFTAKLLAKPHLSELQMLSRAGLGCFLPAILIFIEPDLGTSLVFFAVFFAMLLAAGFPLGYLIIVMSPVIGLIGVFNWILFVVLLAILLVYLWKSGFSVLLMSFVLVMNLFVFLLGPVTWQALKPYQQERVLTFLDPTRDPLGAGYQIIQANVAFGSGGIFGKGFLKGTQKNLNFLPERHTDFIFSVIGEEMGFIGALGLVLLFALMIGRISRIADSLPVREHSVATTGIMVYLAFQLIINIGMNIGIFPTTGIPLPFLSYGGANLLMNSLSIGFVLKYWNEKSFIK